MKLLIGVRADHGSRLDMSAVIYFCIARLLSTIGGLVGLS